MKFQPRAKGTLPSSAPFTNRNEMEKKIYIYIKTWKSGDGGGQIKQRNQPALNIPWNFFFSSRSVLVFILIRLKLKGGNTSPLQNLLCSVFWRVMGCSCWKENKYALIKLKRNFSTANEEPSPRLFPFASLFSF